MVGVEKILVCVHGHIISYTCNITFYGGGVAVVWRVVNNFLVLPLLDIKKPSLFGGSMFLFAFDRGNSIKIYHYLANGMYVRYHIITPITTTSKINSNPAIISLRTSLSPFSLCIRFILLTLNL